MKLTLKAFRGASQPFTIKFDTKQNLSVLYGENGCGKTTVSDALEFVVDGTAGSLEEKSLDGKSRLGQLVNARSDKDDLAVSLTIKDQTRTATLSGSNVQHSGDLPCELKVLSRKNITKLIEETPANRFKRIQDFVSVPALEREEAALNDLLLAEKRNFDTQTKLITQATEILAELFEEHADKEKYEDRQSDWQDEILKESEESITSNLAILQELKQEIARLREDFKPLMESYPALKKSKEEEKSETEALTKLISESAGSLAKAFETIQHAQSFLSKNESDSCPVCDTDLGHEVLVTKVNEKLSTLQAVKNQTEKAKKAQESHKKSQATHETLQRSFYSIIERLRAAHQAAIEADKWEIPDLIPSIANATSAEELTEEWFEQLKDEAAQLKPLSETVDKEHAALQNLRTLQTEIRQAIKRIKDATDDGKRIEFILERGAAIKEVLHDERIRHANETLEAISGDFAVLYQKLHPGEEIENIRLYLHATKKSSAQFDGKLFGKDDASPVAYLSESHLDTLGLCLFLALQKRENADKTILYLDDAIASVDEAHMERLYELLLDEASHFHHVIISSHYQPLRFKFRWGILTQRKVEFLELGAWSIDQGMSMSRGPDSEVALLRRYIEAADDPSTIASKSGIVLERVLDFLTGIYQCRLPRTPGAEQRWTLDQYKGGLKGEKKLLPALRAEHLDEDGQVVSTIEIEPLLNNIFSRLEVRNAIGCHYKELAGHFNEIGEALALGNATLALVDAICDENSTLPDRKKDGCSWNNRGEKITRRLYPLLKPA